MMKLALNAYSDAWKSVFKSRQNNACSEIQVKFTNITFSPNDIVITTPFLVEIGNMVGEFSIYASFAMIELLRERLTNPPVENVKQDEGVWMEGLVNQVKYSELELIANLIEHPMRLSSILKLQKGDVILIKKAERLLVHVDGVPVLTSKYGTLNGQYALPVEHLIQSILKTLEKEQKP